MEQQVTPTTLRPKSSHTTRWRHKTNPHRLTGYRSRSSHSTLLYQIVHHYLDQFETEWELRFQHQFGHLHENTIKTFKNYLNCGIYEHGCARVHCPDYHHSILVPFSCKEQLETKRRMADEKELLSRHSSECHKTS